MPSLREREGELEYLLGALLGMDAFNPDGHIETIGDGAFEELHAAVREGVYDNGNFRMLETVLTRACRRAGLRGSKTICARDIREAQKMV